MIDLEAIHAHIVELVTEVERLQKSNDQWRDKALATQERKTFLAKELVKKAREVERLQGELTKFHECPPEPEEEDGVHPYGCYLDSHGWHHGHKVYCKEGE